MAEDSWCQNTMSQDCQCHEIWHPSWSIDIQWNLASSIGQTFKPRVCQDAEKNPDLKFAELLISSSLSLRNSIQEDLFWRTSDKERKNLHKIFVSCSQSEHAVLESLFFFCYKRITTSFQHCFKFLHTTFLDFFYRFRLTFQIFCHCFLPPFLSVFPENPCHFSRAKNNRNGKMWHFQMSDSTQDFFPILHWDHLHPISWCRPCSARLICN